MSLTSRWDVSSLIPECFLRCSVLEARAPCPSETQSRHHRTRCSALYIVGLTSRDSAGGGLGLAGPSMDSEIGRTIGTRPEPKSLVDEYRYIGRVYRRNAPEFHGSFSDSRPTHREAWVYPIGVVKDSQKTLVARAISPV